MNADIEILRNCPTVDQVNEILLKSFGSKQSSYRNRKYLPGSIDITSQFSATKNNGITVIGGTLVAQLFDSLESHYNGCYYDFSQLVVVVAESSGGKCENR
ncbi:uncharacterized protein J8A68_001971 [[Candida] subhashii]|uniref:Uncharacterized protein n=1 Tax=[Candida] subhashii TaxID=561895 RepID=A0A8J5QLU1_9ASCO|nr:uncharacterized protein J8A68_001971 [[Candida] subhashii]KAG7664498.1 hypothetical protein J8A68_001971 [[Candida] subhashii]